MTCQQQVEAEGSSLWKVRSSAENGSEQEPGESAHPSGWPSTPCLSSEDAVERKAGPDRGGGVQTGRAGASSSQHRALPALWVGKGQCLSGCSPKWPFFSLQRPGGSLTPRRSTLGLCMHVNLLFGINIYSYFSC